MKKFEVRILGCGSALPTLKRNPSSHCVNISDRLYLIDCGEGTQIRLRDQKVKFQRINHIFILHLHGDHYFGLPGLLSSMHLLGRTKDLHVYGPVGLEEVIRRMMELSKTYLNYPLHFHQTNLNGQNLLFEDKSVRITSFPLKHRVDTTGFRFDELPGERKMVKWKIKEFKVGVEEIVKLKSGQSIKREDGSILNYEEFTEAPPAPRSYSYCSDTKYSESIIPYVQNSSLIYHEATFLDEMKKRAKETFHSTAKQAALIAKSSDSSQLIIGHFSSRYADLRPFLKEAKEEFKNTILAEEGLLVEVK